MTQLAEALHGELPGPPVQALYVYNSNPAAIAPDQQRVLAGLRRDDLFVVVHEQFPTDTVDYADIVLPATTQLEHFDLHGSYGHQFVQVNVPAIALLGESRCNTDVFRSLSQRLGFEPELFEVSDEQLARELLWEPGSLENVPATMRGITLDRLKREGAIKLNSIESPNVAAPFANGDFATPAENANCVANASPNLATIRCRRSFLRRNRPHPRRSWRSGSRCSCCRHRLRTS